MHHFICLAVEHAPHPRCTTRCCVSLYLYVQGGADTTMPCRSSYPPALALLISAGPSLVPAQPVPVSGTWSRSTRFTQFLLALCTPSTTSSRPMTPRKHLTRSSSRSCRPLRTSKARPLPSSPRTLFPFTGSLPSAAFSQASVSPQVHPLHCNVRWYPSFPLTPRTLRVACLCPPRSKQRCPASSLVHPIQSCATRLLI